MPSQQISENKKIFLKNDSSLVCGMLAFYGICILALVGATIWMLDKRNDRLASEATATAHAAMTQQANATLTATAQLADHDRYRWVDRFDTNKYRWRSGRVEIEYWSGLIEISDGLYIWDIKDVKQTFITWADFPIYSHYQHFDTYVDTRILEAAAGDVCSGLLFRVSPDGWDEGGYYYGLCHDFVSVHYHTQEGGWERLATIPHFADQADWNRMEVIARGPHFILRLNGVQMFEFDDDRQTFGQTALFVELNEPNPVKVAFDNFGFQDR